jgi:hypothetical protein
VQQLHPVQEIVANAPEPFGEERLAAYALAGPLGFAGFAELIADQAQV